MAVLADPLSSPWVVRPRVPPPDSKEQHPMHQLDLAHNAVKLYSKFAASFSNT